MKKRLSHVLAISFTALSGSALVVACSSEEIVLVTLPDASVDDAAVDAPQVGPRCDDDRDCESDAFCSKPSCTAKFGQCERRPTFCDGTPQPTCGCDGITYWNDCLRKARGQRASTPGECSVDGALRCGKSGQKDCPPGAWCARLAPSFAPSCPPDLGGVCWNLPAVCPATPGVDRFVRCFGAPPQPCVDLCTAIRSGAPHQRVDTCP